VALESPEVVPVLVVSAAVSVVAPVEPVSAEPVEAEPVEAEPVEAEPVEAEPVPVPAVRVQAARLFAQAAREKLLPVWSTTAVAVAGTFASRTVRRWPRATLVEAEVVASAATALESAEVRYPTTPTSASPLALVFDTVTVSSPLCRSGRIAILAAVSCVGSTHDAPDESQTDSACACEGSPPITAPAIVTAVAMLATPATAATRRLLVRRPAARCDPRRRSVSRTPSPATQLLRILCLDNTCSLIVTRGRFPRRTSAYSVRTSWDRTRTAGK
jgi:hypothetical protein